MIYFEKTTIHLVLHKMISFKLNDSLHKTIFLVL